MTQTTSKSWRQSGYYDFILVSCVIIINLALIIPIVTSPTGSDDDPLTGLYSVNDSIEILTSDNFHSMLCNKNHAWVIEFYSHWCGHCQNYAPIYRNFSKLAYNWRDRVLIGAINCAIENNTQLCRNFEVMSYPSVKYFHENYPNDMTKVGEIVSHVEMNALALEHAVIKNLQRDESINKNVPRVTRMNNTRDLWRDVDENVKHLIVIVENDSSFLGAEVALRLHHIKEIVVKSVNVNGDIGDIADVKPPTPSLYSTTRANIFNKITTLGTNASHFSDAVVSFCRTNQINVPANNYTYNTYWGKIQQQKFLDISNFKEKIADKVFQADLENVLHYALYTEISTYKVIKSEQLDALKRFIQVIFNYFPFNLHGRNFLKELNTYVQNATELDGETFSDMVQKLEDTYEPVFKKPLKYVRCRGSSITYRGYPCGLWTLFHYLTVNAEQENHNTINYDHLEVLRAMHGYIKYFFGCQHCKEHFLEMSERRKIFSVPNADESILWLWEAHNEVNKRIAGDASEDPIFKKVQFPANCDKCKNPDGSWNRPEVLAYLQDIYSSQNVVHDFKFDVATSAAARPSGMFNYVDLNMLLHMASLF